MPYVKTNWQDRLVEDPNSFRVTDNGDGTSTIEEAPGEVFVQGTPVSAENLNKMEQGIAEATRIAEEGSTVATQAEAEAGTNNVNKMTPLRVFQAIAKRITDLIATSAEAIAGTVNNKLITPLRLKEYSENKGFIRKDRIEPAVDFNSIFLPGMYHVSQPNTKSENFPIGANAYGLLLVFTTNTSDNRTIQLYGGHAEGNFFFRVNFDGTWKAWRKLANTVETGALSDLTTSTKASLVSAINELKTALTVATQNEAEVGTDNTKIMTPLRVSQATVRNLRNYSKLNLYNLIPGTYDFSGGFLNINRWALVSPELSYKNFPTRRSGDQYFGISKVAELEVGQHTLLAFVKTDPGISIHGYVSGANGGKVNNSDNFQTIFGEFGEFTLVKFTFNVTTRGTFNARFEKISASPGFVYISLLRLFEGDVERPWFRAINDNVYLVATEAEVLEGTEDSKIITPLKLLQSKVATTSVIFTDLNDAVKQGDYYYSQANSQVANKPPFSATGGFYLEVQTSNPNGLPMQTATLINTSETYKRVRYSLNGQPVSWSDWKLLSREVASQAEARGATNNDKVMTPLRTSELITTKYGFGGNIPLLTSTDYNDYVTTGLFRMPANSSNAPASSSTNLFVMSRTNNVLVQVAFNESDGKSYKRYKNGENAWSAWKEDADTGITGNLTQLQTSQKGNLVSAINEAFQFANDGKTRIANVIGSPVVTGDTFTQMQTKIQNIKTTFRDNLVAQGVQAGNNEDLLVLVNKIPLIQSGIRTASGTATSLPGEYGFAHLDGTNGLSNVLQVSGLPFRPKKIIVRSVTGGILYESIYDATRATLANTATVSQYSPGASQSARPYSMAAQNGYITDSSFSIPVGLPSAPYSWYIEG